MNLAIHPQLCPSSSQPDHAPRNLLQNWSTEVLSKIKAIAFLSFWQLLGLVLVELVLRPDSIR